MLGFHHFWIPVRPKFVTFLRHRQSFMMHQIRKMVGLTLAIVRGHTTAETISRSYTADRLDLPKAPGLGLVLDKIHYDRYNERYGSDHDKMEWDDIEVEIELFKEKYIYPTIVNTEITEKSMASWLETLSCHSFDVREEEGGSNNKEETSDEQDDEIEEKEHSRKGLTTTEIS